MKTPPPGPPESIQKPETLQVDEQITAYQIEDIYREEPRDFEMGSGKMRCLMYATFLLLLLLLGVALLLKIPHYVTLPVSSLQQTTLSGEWARILLVTSATKLQPVKPELRLIVSEGGHEIPALLLHLQQTSAELGQTSWELEVEASALYGLVLSENQLHLQFLAEEKSFIFYLLH